MSDGPVHVGSTAVPYDGKPEAEFTVFSYGSTVYYKSDSGVTSGSNDGNIATGASATFTAPTWFATAAGGASSLWFDRPRRPPSASRGAAITQTYATAARTVPNATVAAVATTAATQTTPFGFAGATQADSIPVAINALAADVLALKKVLTAVIDDLQAAGITG